MSSDGLFTVTNIDILKNYTNTCYINVAIHMLTSLPFVRRSIIKINMIEIYSKSNIMEENNNKKISVTYFGVT